MPGHSSTVASKRWLCCAAFSLLCIAAVAFGREMLYRERSMMDFHALCNAARTWAGGGNPYDAAETARQWRASGAEWLGSVQSQVVVYPPSVFPLLAPFSMLSPVDSAYWWIGVELIATVALVWLSLHAAGLDEQHYRLQAMLFASLALTWWPIKAALYHGQPSLPAVAMGLGGFTLAMGRRDCRAGLLLGIALALKPHVAFPFLVCLLLCRRWRPATLATLVAVVLFGIGTWRLTAAGQSRWLADWRANLSTVSMYGASRFDVANLQIPFSQTLHSTEAANVAAWSCFATLLGLFIWLYRRQRTRDDLLTLSTLCALSILPIYHRSPDLCLLLPAAAWAFSSARRLSSRVIVGMTLALMMIPHNFFTEFDALHRLARGFDGLLAMAVLGASLSLLLAMWRAESTGDGMLPAPAPGALPGERTPQETLS